MTPGTKLRLLREAKGLNKNEFTKRVRSTGRGISSAYINNLESGAANSEHVGNHYLKAFARVLEVRDFVMTSEVRDTEIETDAGQVLEEEVLETYLAENIGVVVAAEEADTLRRLVREAGGPKWKHEWPRLCRILRTYRALLLDEPLPKNP